MRPLALLMLIMLAIAGCSTLNEENNPPPGSNNPPVDDSVPQAFADLPSPAGLLQQYNASRGTSKRASSNAVAFGSEWDDALDHSDNITVHAQDMRSVMGGRKDPLTYCIFPVTDGVIPEGVALDSMIVSIGYASHQMAADEGLYVGWADFNTNRWRWYGPQTDDENPLDIDGDGLAGFDGPEFVIVVNYSDVETNLWLVNFSFTMPGEVIGDEYVYYQAPEQGMPGSNIMRVPVGGGTAEVVQAVTTEYDPDSPSIRSLPSGDKLYFVREDNVTSDMTLYLSDMDGSNTEAYAPTGHSPVIVADWSPDGMVEVYATIEGEDFSGAMWNHDTGTGGTISLTAGLPNDAIYDDIATSPVFRAFILVATNPDNDWGDYIYSVQSETLPYTGDGTLVVGDGTEHIMNPETVAIVKADGTALSGLTFASNRANPNDPSDTSYNIWVLPDGAPAPQHLFEESGVNITEAVFSEDGALMAFIVKQPGNDLGDLYVTPTFNPEMFTDISPLATNVSSELVWYDPTP